MTRVEELKSYPWRLWTRQVATITRMELRKSLFRWRSLWIYLLALAPVGIIGIHALVDHHQNSDMREDIQVLAGIFQFYYLRLAIFFGCLGIFTRLIRGEMVDRSLHYYLLAPVRRELLVIGKFIAGVITSVMVFGIAVFMATCFMYLHFGQKGMQFLTDGAGAYPGRRHLCAAHRRRRTRACLGRLSWRRRPHRRGADIRLLPRSQAGNQLHDGIDTGDEGQGTRKTKSSVIPSEDVGPSRGTLWFFLRDPSCPFVVKPLFLACRPWG